MPRALRPPAETSFSGFSLGLARRPLRWSGQSYVLAKGLEMAATYRGHLLQSRDRHPGNCGGPISGRFNFHAHLDFAWRATPNFSKHSRLTSRTL